MSEQIPLTTDAVAETSQDGPFKQVSSDIAYRQLVIVNVVFIGQRQAKDRGWVLIDAGLPGTEPLITHAAHDLFGSNSRPAAILLTHGHFDHVGVLAELAERWDVPIYAHELEIPYLNGNDSYPPPDPSVGGGLLARLSPLFPRGPIDVSPRLNLLPSDHSVPFLPGWRWLPTPGHSPGHVSFWREADRTLIAGDAVITTRQEALYASVTQKPELHGPPQYYTPDWKAAEESAQALAALEPDLLVTGHGAPMHGEAMRSALHTLARDFRRIAVPAQGRYVERSET